MTPNEFQKACERTLVRSRDINLTQDQISLLWAAVGIAGEGGEIAELAKKQIFHKHGLDIAKWKEELGDLAWYLATCCTSLGLTLEEVFAGNIEKLAERFPDGFDPARTSGAKQALAQIAKAQDEFRQEGIRSALKGLVESLDGSTAQVMVAKGKALTALQI